MAELPSEIVERSSALVRRQEKEQKVGIFRIF